MNSILLSLTQGFDMLAIGMIVVFSVLLLLFAVFSQLKRIAAFFSEKDKAPKSESSPQKAEVELTGDVNAAISMALYLYLNDQHDHESGVVTIMKAERKYSPWNSKIYGMNNIIK